MYELDFRIIAAARRTDSVLDRATVHSLGATDQIIRDRLRRGQWLGLQRGVYLIGIGPPTWRQRLRAAVAAAGPGAEVSHRAAVVLRGFDGMRTAPVELVVPFNGEPTPRGAIVHRSRRVERPSVVDGMVVTGIERMLLEVGAVAPAVVVEKAFSCAWRRNLTSPAKCRHYLEHHGGRGRHGTCTFRRVIDLYEGTGKAPGSDGEVAFLRLLRAAGIEEPVRQLLLDLPGGGKASVDFAWPDRRKLVEFVGLEVHADSRAHDDDTLREDDLKSLGWELRRFAPHSLATRPDDVARRVIRFLRGVPGRDER